MSQVSDIATRARFEIGGVGVLARAGVVRPLRPDRLAGVINAITRWGHGPAAGYIAGSSVAPDEPALIDELGTLSFREVEQRTNAIAQSLHDLGVGEGDRVALMCRNHRGFVEVTTGVAKLGADVLYLNTAFSGPQLAEVVERERPVAIVYDEEFTELLGGCTAKLKRFVAWHDGDDPPADDLVSDLIAAGSTKRPPAPDRKGRTVILTSGTTGTPKGASRRSPTSLDPAIALLSRIPLHAREITHIAAPLFHTWGYAHFTLAMLLQSTITLRRKFDPEGCLAEVQRREAKGLVVVPVMLQRILELPAEVRARYDVSSLQVVPVSGSALPGKLALEWMDQFGENLYNLYGSTEVAWASIADPQDLRDAPGTAGRVPRGTVVKIYDDAGKEQQAGTPGRIFVANEMLFDGYTGGGGKDRIDGLMATGDMGHIDAEGRLFVEGRDDEMIVSGGENLFPQEVEDMLASRDDVAEVAAIGVADERFGQRLRAFVVCADGASPSEAELKAHVKVNLASYKVPREIWFIDELPRNATGKILKRELREIETDPSGAQSAAAAD